MKLDNDYYNCTASTIKSPIAFFSSFFVEDKINNAKNRFIERMPDRNDPDDPIARSVSYVSPNKLEYHLEHTIWDENTYENITQIISLDNELENMFRDQYLNSKELLKQKLEPESGEELNTKEKREIVRVILKKASTYYQIIQKNNFYSDNREVCYRPIISIIKLIYDEYNPLAQDPRSNDIILSILSESNKNGLYEIKQLKPESIEKLFDFIIKPGLKIFDSQNKSKDIEFLKFFLLGEEPKEIKRDVRLFGQVGLINYTIALLLEYANMSRPFLEKQNFLYINNIKFVAGSCDTDFYRYPLAHPKEANTVASLIES